MNEEKKEPCNENQLDALFILSLFRHSTSTCFGHICSSSSGGILYIYNNWYVLCLLVDCVLANRQSTEKHNTYQLLYIYSVPFDDGLQIYPKHVEVVWRNKRKINSIFIISWCWAEEPPETCREIIEINRTRKRCILLFVLERFNTLSFRMRGLTAWRLNLSSVTPIFND